MRFHCNAATNLSQRRAVAASPLSLRAQASLLGVSPTTVRRWKGREEFQDRNSRPLTVRRAFGDDLEAAALSLRRRGLALDACLDALREGFGKVARSTLHALFARHGLGRLPKAKPEKRAFRDYPPGFLHVDLAYPPALGGRRRYLLVAVDRATRLAFAQVRERKATGEAAAFLSDALALFPFKAHRPLTDDGSELANRLWGRRASGTRKEHPVEALCRERGVSRRLTAPHTPRTNGMAERFDRLAKEGAARNARHGSHAAVEDAVLRWRRAYNAARPHGGIQRRTPLQEAGRWYKQRPEIFHREPTQEGHKAFLTYPD